MAFASQPKAVIGVSTTSGSSARDTLGVLVSSVRPDSPAEHAGINEGDRIASVNGVSLKLSAADIGDEDMAGVMARRLARELEKLNPGDEVDLRVVSDGQTKTLKIKPGRYLYKFVMDGDRWRADPGNPDHAGQNGNSVLHVGEGS